MEESLPIIVVRNQRYDPSLERWVDDELPTVKVTRATRLRTASAHAALASKYIASGTAAISAGTAGYGSVARLTYLNIYANKELELYLKDRNGTIDYVYLPAKGERTLFGNARQDFRVIEGSFSVRFLGSQAAGTYAAAFDYTIRSMRR